MEYNDYKSFCVNVQKYGCTCEKLDINYNIGDHRCWTSVLNKGTDNILVTYHVNKTDLRDKMFDILADGKVIQDIEVEDIYDTIDLLLNKNSQAD